MRNSIRKEFGDKCPRAIVLDDNARARRMTARRLRGRGFEVVECKNSTEFMHDWKPGTVDVIVADWQLSNNKSELGDQMLCSVRGRDWDVPFVLVSGKLDLGADRAPVLEKLLESGGARFVKRGTNGIRLACDEAEDLIERRDLALLKVILSLREGALNGATIQTTSGARSVGEVLEGIVSKPQASHDAGRPIAQVRGRRAAARAAEKASVGVSRVRR
jgi:CheY-like chemotaxis protein